MIDANLRKDGMISLREIWEIDNVPGLCVQPEHLHCGFNIEVGIHATCDEDLILDTAATVSTTGDIEIRKRLLLPISRLHIHHESLCLPRAAGILATCQYDTFVR